MATTFIKIGGSLITDKSKEYTLRLEHLTKIAKEIARAKKEAPQMHIILGTGAGSFAHTSAKKYGTARGAQTKEDKFGLCVVHADAIKLHSIVLETFLAEGLPVFGVTPSSLWRMREGIIYDPDPTLIQQLLQQGLIPCLFGDAFLDEKKGSGILSTDRIASLLIEMNSRCTGEFHIQQIIHAGDYQGVIDAHGEIVPRIHADDHHMLEHLFHDMVYTDVTGGMKGKVEEMQTVAKKYGIVSIITDGLQAGQICNALLGNEIRGTYIVP